MGTYKVKRSGRKNKPIPKQLMDTLNSVSMTLMAKFPKAILARVEVLNCGCAAWIFLNEQAEEVGHFYTADENCKHCMECTQNATVLPEWKYIRKRSATTLSVVDPTKKDQAAIVLKQVGIQGSRKFWNQFGH